MALHVLEPGMLTTVQDAGRFGHGVLGVSASGAADALSLRVGNLLVGNSPDAPALEMTLVGGAFRFDAAAVIALAGSDFGATLGERPLPPWTATRVEAGEIVRVGRTRAGARCLLCVRGGIAVPPVLGSASTHLRSGLGGLEGRAVRRGDVLPIGPDPGTLLRRLRTGAEPITSMLFRRVLRVTEGPQADWFTPTALAQFHATDWEVTEEADRMGLRLSGLPLARAREGQMLTEGVCLGAVQLPDNGQPIILFVDQQTTGGYPKIANIVTADLPAVGQLRPRDRVRFEPVSFAQARALLREQEALLADALEPT